MMRGIFEWTTIFLIGAGAYCLIELLWRGRSHWTMCLTGGLCFSAIYLINMLLPNGSILLKCSAGALFITSIEFLVGYVINLKLKWNVWDYSALRFNVLGQICARYTVYWFFLCIPATYICALLKAGLFH